MKNRHTRKNDRRSKQDRGQEKVVAPKFKEERQHQISQNLIKPMGPKQQYYQNLLLKKSVILASGHPGTSKTFLPTCMAADQIRLGKIDKLYLVRPPVSNSKSLGFFSGSVVEKTSYWLMPILSTLKERLSPSLVEYYIENEQIIPVPLEVIKGNSFKDCFIICDEAEDLTIEECKKIITRVGDNCTMVLSGDIQQSELKDKSGLRWLINLLKAKPELQQTMGHVDFNEYTDIVRSAFCKQIVESIDQYEKELGK